MSENHFSLLSAQKRNKCQVATILLNFFFFLHWRGENYPICTSIASCFSDSQRSKLYSSFPTLLHDISKQYGWVQGRSQGKHLFIEVVLSCLKAYVWNTLLQTTLSYLAEEKSSQGRKYYFFVQPIILQRTKVTYK